MNGLLKTPTRSFEAWDEDLLPVHRPAADGFVEPPNLDPWLRVQALNTVRHAAALRPFLRNEFGTEAASPSDAHIDAANELIENLRSQLRVMSREIGESARAAIAQPESDRLQNLLIRKERSHDWVQAIEQIWDFYFELFGQRQSRFGNWLLGCDRIALDCYQDVFMGLGCAKSVPAPAPFPI